MLAVRAALIAGLLVGIFALSVSAQLNPDLFSPNIVINLPSRTLELYSGDTLVRVYPIAIGKPSTPSPMGSFQIFEKEVNPWWFPPRTGEAVPSGPGNPLGYRWLGFHALYGIHGTNAPWAIGSAVSNGCIRMHESDVEELFEVVTYGTPVRITYDRIKVQVDAQGQASIGVYPDIYGYGGGSVEETKRKLAALGLNGLLDDGEIARMIDEEADKQVVFAAVHTVKVNGKPLAERAVTINGVMYVPVWPVANALSVSLTWDESTQLVKRDDYEVPGVVKGGSVYVTAPDAHRLFGGQQLWAADENVLAIDVLAVYLNGRPVPTEVQVVDGILALPVKTLADALGQKVVAKPDGSLTAKGTKIPCTVINGRAYIQITKICDVFNAYVYWDQQARSIELTYPFRVKGGND